MKSWAYQAGSVENGGMLTGTVRFDGPIPDPYAASVAKDAAVINQTLPDERLLISNGGSVRNVVILIEGIQQGKPWPDLQPRLVSEGGRITPYIQVVRMGTELEIVNRDPAAQNVDGLQGGRTIFDCALPRYRRDRPVFQTLADAGFVKVVRDGHDRMSAWVVVGENPYFAITGEDGTYTITDIPPQTYSVTAWHEKLGIKQVSVEIISRRKAELDITFSTPQKLMGHQEHTGHP